MSKEFDRLVEIMQNFALLMDAHGTRNKPMKP